MLNDLVEIEEIRTADSVVEANRLITDGWELLGFHAAPSSAASTTIFVLGRISEDYVELEEGELEEDFEPVPS